MNEGQSSNAGAVEDRRAVARARAKTPIDVVFDVVMLDGVETGADEERLGAIVPFVLSAEDQSGSWEITLALTDDLHLRDLHARFMGIDENTDVMTFPFDRTGPIRGGEIVVSVERAAEQGIEHGLSAAGEVEFLLVHGLLHLCGWDDQAPGAREAMLARQSELLAAFERESRETRL
jgi:probable rRNA maturation factor